MKHAGLAMTIALALLAALCGAYGQTGVPPEPIVRVTIDPARVVVGQKTTLRIIVLAPNYMMSPPVLPDFQVRNAVTRQLQSINLNEQHEGTTYAGVRFEYALYPQEPGSYAISNQTITLKYAAEPPQTHETTVTLPHIDFQAMIPDAASSLNPFVSAAGLTVEQNVQRSSGQLKVGNSVTRTVTIKAEGTPAMLLPPVHFTTSDGLTLYPAQPSLQDRIDQRTDLLSAVRVDSATYMLERPGDYLLPAIDLGWWDAREQRVERVHLDTLALQVAENPDLQAAPVSESGSGLNWDALIDFTIAHWLSIALASIGLGIMAWFAPRMAQRIATQYRRQRQAYLQSEARAFAQLRSAIRRRDAMATYSALLEWIVHLGPAVPFGTIKSFKSVAADSVLDAQIEQVERNLYGPQGTLADWSPQLLLRQIRTARRALLRRCFHLTAAHALPSDLNPSVPQTAVQAAR